MRWLYRWAGYRLLGELDRCSGWAFGFSLVVLAGFLGVATGRCSLP